MMMMMMVLTFRGAMVKLLFRVRLGFELGLAKY